MTVGSAVVLGRITDRVIVPAFAAGRVDGGQLAVRRAAVLAVSCSAPPASWRAGWARDHAVPPARDLPPPVTRQYLRLPLSGTTGTRQASC
jgi:hypothetical protein